MEQSSYQIDPSAGNDVFNMCGSEKLPNMLDHVDSFDATENSTSVKVGIKA